MVTKVPKTGKETVAPAELAARADAMQTRKRSLKFMRAANRAFWCRPISARKLAG